jgi:hypothetical protein
VLAIGGQVGCTREFYREWANQDVTEVVFEKSRDPRWRLDLFSVEPPALSRFADPYDQEVPPAPPDDPAAEALSPVPQWPDNRLIIPVEGTGYLQLLDKWRREAEETRDPFDSSDTAFQPPRPVSSDNSTKPPTGGSPFGRPAGDNRMQGTAPGEDRMEGAAPTPPAATPPPAPPTPPIRGGTTPTGDQASLSPRVGKIPPPGSPAIVRLQSDAVPAENAPAGQAGGNPGPKSIYLSPIQLSPAQTSSATAKIPPPRAWNSLSNRESIGKPALKDTAVKPVFVSNFQAAQPRENVPQRGNAGSTAPNQDPTKPSEFLDPNITTPPALDAKQLQEIGKMTVEQAAELSGVLVPRVQLQTDEEGYGYPKGSRPYKINMQQAWLLALMNARFYQYNLEQVYLTALPLTLQRFSYDPQFYAGMGSVTGVPQIDGSGGGTPSTPGVTTSNVYTYSTRYAPNGGVKTLNLGTVAGVGKLFSTGGQLLMGFANEVAFNFMGKNPNQPNVISALPIQFMQPLLKGGGRAVTLEPLTQAERNLLYAIRTFALFRQQFLVVTLTGGSIQNFGAGFNLSGFSAPGNTDPVIGFIPVVFNLVEVEIDRRNLAFFENLVNLYSELIQGESSGLSQLQVDQVMQRLITTRQALFQDKITYRTQLDEFKMQMSIPPDTPMIVDMSLAQPFYDVFNAVDNWQRRADRSLSELPGIISKIPELEDIDVDGRSVLGPYRNYRSTIGKFRPENEEGLEDMLQSAVRLALEYRMDLMNNRAQLYDAWRQIRVTANSLMGALNFTISNNVYAPVASPNPFDFLSQARQFSLTFNAELPLVRVNERNNFRESLITYQRTRRSLQTAEDNLKIQLRNDLRSVHLNYINYEIAKRNFELNVRLKDQAFEQIVAPPAGGTQSLAQTANAATQTTNLLGFQSALVGAQLALTNGWQAYQTARLIVYRDIGILPYDEWEAFSELYPSQYHGPIIGHAPPGGAGFTPPPEARTATPESR